MKFPLFAHQYINGENTDLLNRKNDPNEHFFNQNTGEKKCQKLISKNNTNLKRNVKQINAQKYFSYFYCLRTMFSIF